MTALDRAAKLAGSLAKLASLIGVSPSAPGMWKHRGNIPAEYCAAIEKTTGVRRQELRPDDWRAIWPELVKPKVKRSRAAPEATEAGQV